MTDGLIPVFWAQDAHERLSRGLSPLFGLLDIPIRDRQTLVRQIALPPEWLAERAEFVAEWEAFTAAGIEAGFLERDGCYECAGEIVPTTSTTRREEYPNPDYVPPPETGATTLRIPFAGGREIGGAWLEEEGEDG